MRRFVAIALLIHVVAASSNFSLSILGYMASDCGRGWGCFRQGCDSGSKYSCEHVAMYRKTSIYSENTRETKNYFEFVISSKGHDYAAVGFSVDQSMGDDEVIACVKRADGSLLADHYVNPGFHTAAMQSGQNLLTMIDSFNEGGQIGCRFYRPYQPPGVTGYFDLTRPHYQLYAYGPVIKDRIAFHAPVKYPTASAKMITITTDRPIIAGAVRAAPAMILMAAFLMTFTL